MKTARITEFGLLLATALVLAYLESLLPVIVAVPGVKLGLANIVTILILYRFDGKRAFFFMTLRVMMAGFLFSGAAGIVYSFIGGIFCILAMSIVSHCTLFSVLGVSMLGALFHNVGQIFVAVIVTENMHIVYYLPVLCISAVLTGMVTGYLSYLLLKQLNRILSRD